ncbi:phosphatidate cytidylyltransferase [Flavobacteriales bacterium]|nr:phosphatidate cytidylyltransferase [Flavobacteriales bacterium]
MISEENRNRLIYGIIYITFLLFGITFSTLSCSVLFGIIGVICLHEIWKLRKGKKKIFAILYVFTPFILIQILIWKYLSFNIYDTENWNFEPILYLVILTSIYDTFAYLVGVRFGKNKIIPTISPKKSWEGFFGGFLFTAFASAYFFNNDTTTFLFYSFLIPISATTGDFIESSFKRQADVKDSGNLIPGHGGMLDRMDSLLISISIISLLIICT